MISVVVATYNRLEKLDRCIRTFCEAHRGKLEYEIIVALDGGPDVEAMKAIAAKHSAKFVHLENNSGCGHANNAGIRAASNQSECVVVVNDDVWFEEAVCLKLCSILLENPHIGIVGARLLYPDGVVQHAGLDARILHIARGLPGASPLARENRDAVSVTSALMCISKKLLDIIHGFDERYRMGYEDIDICFKARELGWITHYCGDAWAFHDEGGTRGQADKLVDNKEWSEWNSSGHNIFFNTWSSSSEAFCYDSVTFVIETTGKSSLTDSLACISKQMSNRDEVVVVDSESNPETRRLVENFGFRFRYFEHPVESPASKFNFGLKHATGCSISFVREGDLYDADALKTLRLEIRRHPLKPMLFRVRRVSAPENVEPQMILIPNCPDFIPTWHHELCFDSEATAVFVRELVARWPGNSLIKQDIVIA